MRRRGKEMANQNSLGSHHFRGPIGPVSLVLALVLVLNVQLMSAADSKSSAADSGGSVAGAGDSGAKSDPRIKVSPKVPIKAYEFSLKDVRLLDGPFHEAMLRDQKFLLAVDPDRLIHSFRLVAGLPSTATPYGGWEAIDSVKDGKTLPGSELRGHSMGHFLSACALMYSSTGDERFKAKAEKLVAELDKVQQAMP